MLAGGAGNSWSVAYSVMLQPLLCLPFSMCERISVAACLQPVQMLLECIQPFAFAHTHTHTPLQRSLSLAMLLIHYQPVMQQRVLLPMQIGRSGGGEL